MTSGRIGKHRWCRFDDPIYYGYILGIYGPSEGVAAMTKRLVPPAYRSLLSDVVDETNAGNAVALGASGQAVVSVVTIAPTGHNALVALAHETFHASTNVLHNAGLRLCDETQEAFAYHFSWMFDTLRRGLKL